MSSIGWSFESSFDELVEVKFQVSNHLARFYACLRAKIFGRIEISARPNPGTLLRQAKARPTDNTSPCYYKTKI